MPKKNKIKKIAERGSVKFHRIGRTTFWLTPTNRVFLIIPPDVVVFPRLVGGIVSFDDPNFEPGDAVREWLHKTLDIQKSIRTDWPTLEEDNVAFTYHF